MDAGRDAALFGLLREGSGPLSDLVRTLEVRPTFVFGPHDHTERFDYWIDRVANFDRVLVPGDGDNLVHHVYVKDVASALRVVAERGKAGEAYNVADRRVCTMADVIDLIADALGTSVAVVHTSERELAEVGLDPDDFVLYHHLGSRPTRARHL